MRDIPPNLIQSLADDELPPESAADLARRIAADEALQAEVAAAVRFERELRSRVGAVMSEAAPGCPPGLADRIRSSLAAADRAGRAAPSKAAPRRWRRLFVNPQRASVSAIAASLLLIAGAVLFGIFGRPIDSMVVRAAEAATFAALEHQRCGSEAARNEKFTWSDPVIASARMHEYLGRTVPINDLTPEGYRFVGAAKCAVPGAVRSCHLLYLRDCAGCPRTLVSVFVMPDTGGDVGVPVGRPWEWGVAGGPPTCRKLVACCTDGRLVYLVVCCDDGRVPELTAALASGHSRAARP